LFGLFGRGQAISLEVLLVQHLFEMPLRLFIEFVESLTVINS
jgi:hypothetical protein